MPHPWFSLGTVNEWYVESHQIGAGMTGFYLSEADEILRILEGACFNRELLILATARGRFESHFIHVDAGALHVAPTMSGEAVLYELRSEELSLRFPAGSRFLEGKTRLLGHGMVEGRRTLRMALPAGLQDDELRRGHRVTRTGRVEVSFHTKRYNLHAGQLLDISTGGLRIHAPTVNLDTELAPGDRIALTIPLEERVRIDAKGLVRWVAGRNMGLEFDPPLDRGTMATLSRWVFQRREEERELALPGVGARTAGTQPAPSGELLLVSGTPELEEALRAALGGLGGLVRIPGTLQALKEALVRNPAIILFHTKGSGLDDRHRLKAMVEQVGNRWPCVLLGTDMEPAQLFQLASDLKLPHSFGFRPSVAPFFNRMVGGLLRRAEAPETRAEAQP